MLVQWRASALLFNTTGYYYCIRNLRVPYNTIGSYIRDLEGAQPHCPELGPSAFQVPNLGMIHM